MRFVLGLFWEEPAAESIGKLRPLRIPIHPAHDTEDFLPSFTIRPVLTSPPFSVLPSFEHDQHPVIFSFVVDYRLPHVSRSRLKCVAGHFLHESSLPCPTTPYNRRGYSHSFVAPSHHDRHIQDILSIKHLPASSIPNHSLAGSSIRWRL